MIDLVFVLVYHTFLRSLELGTFCLTEWLDDLEQGESSALLLPHMRAETRRQGC